MKCEYCLIFTSGHSQIQQSLRKYGIICPQKRRTRRQSTLYKGAVMEKRCRCCHGKEREF